MRHLLLSVLLMLYSVAYAQTNLTGRVYHHPNIMAEQFKELNDDELRKKAIESGEKKKGRKLTEKELADIDKKLQQHKKELEAVRNGMTLALTIEFKSATEAILRQKTRVDDNMLKVAGYGWLKRKALKAAIAMMPESQTMKYEVKGNKVYFVDPKDKNDRDTLTLGSDGNTISGFFEKETRYTLKRTK